MRYLKRLLAKYPVLCAWCDMVIGECEIQSSHGICKTCSDKMLSEVG